MISMAAQENKFGLPIGPTQTGDPTATRCSEPIF
jgi:hypothetical protein